MTRSVSPDPMNELLPISVCFVARDAEDVIAAAIQSVAFVREIVVVVDERSQDDTERAVRDAVADRQHVEIAREQWRGHVAQKNAAIDRAENEWVLCLDADESVSEELRGEVIGLFATGSQHDRSPEDRPRCDGYSFPRRNVYFGRWIRHGGWYPDRKLRLFRKTRGRWQGTDPHDRVVVDRTTGELRGHVIHESYQSVRQHLEKIDRYATIAARGLWQRGVRRPVIRMWVHPLAKFVKAYLLKGGCLDGFPGFVIAGLGAFAVFLKYAKLWEILRAESLARKSGAARAEILLENGGAERQLNDDAKADR